MRKLAPDTKTFGPATPMLRMPGVTKEMADMLSAVSIKTLGDLMQRVPQAVLINADRTRELDFTILGISAPFAQTLEDLMYVWPVDWPEKVAKALDLPSNTAMSAVSTPTTPSGTEPRGFVHGLRQTFMNPLGLFSA